MSESNRPEQPPTELERKDETSLSQSDSETPIFAVWLALGAIVIAGLYGLYLGIHARTPHQVDTEKVSALVVDFPLGHSQVFARRSA
jgi:hypothetical protein